MTTSLCSFMLLSGKGTYREGSNYLAIYNRMHRPTLRRESMPTTGLTSPAKVRLGRRRLVSTRQHVPTSRLPGHPPDQVGGQPGLRHVEQLAVVAWVERAARSPGPIAMKLSPGHSRASLRSARATARRAAAYDASRRFLRRHTPQIACKPDRS